MLTYAQARSAILERIVPLGTEKVPLLEAVGRVVSADIEAPWDLPGSNNSAMDGFAVRAAECAPDRWLKITDYIPAGTASDSAVPPGGAARIMTGAPLPPGADSVVPLEETEERSGEVRMQKPVPAGNHVRIRGEDVARGETVVPAGTVVLPPQVSMLASCGIALVPVYRKPRVAILSTGDELVELGTTPGRGEIVNSNAYAIAAAVKLCGAEPVLIGTARDDAQSHRALIREGLKADVLVTSAGVSAGDRDLVRETLAELGVSEVFWKVLMKPGSPTAFALYGTTPVFSLPGNPVATMITFEEFVAPSLLKMMGQRRILRRTVRGVLREEARKKEGNLHFLRVRVEQEGDRYLATSSGDQKTGILKTLLGCNALALLPEGSSRCPAGTEVDLHLIDDSLLRVEEAEPDGTGASPL
ncbi:molybdopterin molybdotransferase MoeA [Geomesophilobacter sediminis]|uniref:Molybdopterin molybdenumtransferase n=1 Tax=Geomesophilobacter sediminis TaxID=2798584 RepID=A0A8J7LUA4_9BACT|nr:gephyrin-like molybdotransferase Glp [Geomesophilobacter sediminis]MBJ6724424.1 molybdopterin molybdotransferase MoeA [Geomesophilobacter sediminis]